MESCSSFVTRNVSVLNLFCLITSVLIINRFALVCNGFIILNHISSKQAMVLNLNHI